MKLLDLKKLMLVPLACCVLVQQTDAATQEDQSAKHSISPEAALETIIEQFKNLVILKEEEGIGVKVRNGTGQEVEINPNLRVASDIRLNGKRFGLLDCQMGGIIATISDTTPPEVTVFKGVKRIGEEAADNSRNLYATSEGSHTERLLVGAALTKRKNLSGRHFIYTHLPPCALGPRADNGNMDCCEYYAKVTKENGGANFYIFFRTPKLDEIKGYIRFDTYKKLRCLWTFVANVLGTTVYELAANAVPEDKQLNGTPLAILTNLRVAGGERNDNSESCLAVAGFLFKCLRGVFENQVQTGKNYGDVKWEGSKKYAESVERLYGDLMRCYAADERDFNRIHFYSLDI